MRSIFTIYTGEFLVGEFIKQTFPRLNVWIPSKDTGIDLFITDEKNTKLISIQTKPSRDYLPSHEKIVKSKADYG